jgi:S-adenosylmethionine hydrolase
MEGPVSKKRLVIVTDCTDVAFAEIRGAVFRHCGETDFTTEPLVPVETFSIVNAAFVTRLVAEAYPEGTTICVIVNSVVPRTERIIGRTRVKNLIFEGTNTGAFGWLLKDFGCSELYEVTDPGFVPFGGKYVHAPAVGKALSGVPLSDLGSKFALDKVRDVECPPGTVVHRDNFGNIKFPYVDTAGFREGAHFLAEFASGSSVRAVYGRRMMEHPTGTWVLYPGSSFDLFEIGQVRSPGFGPLSGVTAGDRVVLRPL